MNPNTAKSERYFYLGIGIWFLVISFIGFSQTFYINRDPQLSMNLIIHGVLFSCWILLFFVQTTLISIQKVKTHRALGFIGLALILAMIPAGYYTVLYKVSLGNKGLDDGGYNLFTLTVAYVFVFLGLSFRNKKFFHKRFMLFATLIFTIAATDRVAYLIELDHSQLFRKSLVFFPAIALFIFDYIKLKSLIWFDLLPILAILILFFFSDFYWLSALGQKTMKFLVELI